MVTLSEARGTIPPVHVVVKLQFAVCAEVILALTVMITPKVVLPKAVVAVTVLVASAALTGGGSG